jgi:cytidylate kinase
MMIITIDGPSASGKSTAAYKLACDLNYMYLNTGLLYRACAYALVNDFNYSPELLIQPRSEDVDAVIAAKKINYDFASTTGAVLFYDGVMITQILKKSPYDKWASVVSADSYVRGALLSLQRMIAKTNNVIAEGRDCGTVVFPNAQHKFFMTASLDARANRWLNDQRIRGTHLTFEEAQALLLERDERDTNRDAAPLRVPESAYVIDSSKLSCQEVVNLLKEYIKVDVS